MHANEIYLDANATTPVMVEARAAALDAMADAFGNPSSVHGTGLKARAMMSAVRACARRVIGAPQGRLLFLSGATEGIQTAVLSALTALRDRAERGEAMPDLLLYGATEHKAVPEALQHWRRLLRLDLQVLAIPVGRDGRHDLDWLRRHAPRAGLVCTMAANNETGVISDLDGIQAALAGSPALWMVDSVQALGKLPLQLGQRPIDYAPFSGHKLYAPKGIGMLYVREGAPLTPLLAGGGQEDALRSGTENMPGIAALGAVLRICEHGTHFQSHEALERHRQRLVGALREAFDGIVFNADPAISLPTTVNFSVPQVSSRVLLDLFDAASIRVSSGSACGATKAAPSYVLAAMGLEAWRCASAVRLSFGPLADAALIEDACQRIRQCGLSLRDSCMTAVPQGAQASVELLTRHVVDGAVCYLVADADTRRCVVIDPIEDLTESLAQWIQCRGFTLAAVLATHHDAGLASAAAALWQDVGAVPPSAAAVDVLGWPAGAESLPLGRWGLKRLALPEAAAPAATYLLADAHGVHAAFVGQAVQSDALQGHVDRGTLLLPAHDAEGRYARLPGTADAQADTSAALAGVELQPHELMARAAAGRKLLMVDVREPYEHRLGQVPIVGSGIQRQAVPLSALLNALPQWLTLADDTDLVLFCRSGNRSAQAARALRQLGQTRAWSLAGGMALWPARSRPFEGVVA